MGKIIAFLFVVLLIFLGVYFYLFSDIFLIKPTALQDKQEIGFEQSFEIDFPYSINAEYYKSQITLEPRTGMKATINKERNKIVLTPNKLWKENTEYKITLPKGRTTYFMPIKKTSFTFQTPKNPEIVSITPENGLKDVIVNGENPIVINFDKSTEDFFVDFTITPTVEVTYQNNEDKNSFEIFPVGALQEGTEYKIEVKSKPKNASDDYYKKIYETSFTTFLTPKPKTWAEKLNDRLEFAKLNTQPRITEGKYIDIDLASQVMVTFENGVNMGTYLISTGKSGMNTPRGTWQILNKNPRAWSNKYKLYMPYWMAITNQGHGIHELPEWPNGYKEGANHLGIAVSHGCVRLGMGNAQLVYSWAEVGTRVIVH